MKSKHLVLLLLIPLSEIKAVFYNSDLKIRYSLFTEETRYLCNVLEWYSNIFIIAVVFYFLAFSKIDIITKQIALFLFIINALDFVFLGLLGNFLYLLKIPISIIIFYICNFLKTFSMR